MSKQLSEKGKIFKGYVEQILAHHEFGSMKMVSLEPDYWTDLSNEEAWKLVDELIAAGYMRKYYTQRTFHRGSKGFRRSYTTGYVWIGLTAKGWSVANKYLNA